MGIPTLTPTICGIMIPHSIAQLARRFRQIWNRKDGWLRIRTTRRRVTERPGLPLPRCELAAAGRLPQVRPVEFPELGEGWGAGGMDRPARRREPARAELPLSPRRRRLAGRGRADIYGPCALPVRWQPSLFHLSRRGQWSMLRPAGGEALWPWSLFPVPPLLSPCLCQPERG